MHRRVVAVGVISALALGIPSSPALAQERVGPPVADTAAARTAAPGAPLPVDPSVRIGTLDNGLRYFVRRNERPEKRAELRLVVNAGSVLEDRDQQGLAHFLEHMAFNGTEHFAKQELVDWLESVGMKFGPEINAYTGFDETVYMLQIPTDRAGVVDTAFQVLEDWAHGISLDPTEIDKERGVILEEWRLGRGAQSRIRDEQLPVLLAGSRYAERLPIGDTAVIRHFERPALLRFYRQWYRPDLIAVVAVGDFDPDAVIERIHRHFDRIADPPDERTRPVFRVPINDTTDVESSSDPELSVSSVSVTWKRPPTTESTHADFRRSLVERLYNSALNFRFFEITQASASPPFLYAGSSRGSLVRGLDVYRLAAAVPEGGIDAGLERLLVEARRVDRYGFAASELEREKADMLRSYERAFAEREKTESDVFASEYVRSFTEDEPIPGIAYEYALARRYAPGIEVEEVNRLGRGWIADSGRVVLSSSPAKEGLHVPTDAELLAVLGRADARQVEPWEDTAGDQPLVAEPPRPGSVVAESTLAAVGVTEWRLSNGARVLLKPTDFKQDQVLFSGWSPGGTSLAPDSDYVSAAWAASLVSAGGAGAFSAVDLQKKLAGKAVSVGPSISELEEGVSGFASPRDLETMLQLTWLYFTAPRRDSVAVASLLSRVATVIENRGSDPQAVWADTLQVTLASHNPRRRPPTVGQLDEVDLDRALAFYRDRFSDAGDFTFTFVGAFDPDELRPLVERWLASLPATGRDESWRDVGIRPPPGVVERTVRKGIEPKAMTTVIFHGPFDFSRPNRYRMDAVSDVLSIMLREVLREDLGGTYGVSVAASPQRDPYPHYAFRLTFGADPGRVDGLTEAAFSVVDSLARTGASPENLEKVKEAQRRQRETDLRDNGFWLSAIGVYDRWGEDLALIADYDALVDGLTAADVAEGARQWLDPRRFVRVTLLPEGAPEAPGNE